MSGSKTRPSICTCPSVICMPPSTRSISSRHAQNRSSDGDDAAPLRGGRCDPYSRQKIPRTRTLDLAAGEGARRHRPLPHRRARRASRSVLQLRLSSHLLQLVPQPALPQVPDQRSRPVASQAAAGTAARCYYYLVFSLPHALVPLMWQNKRRLFALLFEAGTATLLEVAADPKHLGARIGLLSILHTLGQTLQSHPPIHCVVPGRGL